MKRDKGMWAKRIMNACNKRDRDELSEVLSEMPSTELLEMIVVCGMNTNYVWEVLQGKHGATSSDRQKRVDARRSVG